MAGKKVLWVHAGMGKTGSSAIQHFLRTNTKGLADQGSPYCGIHFEEVQPGAMENHKPLTEQFSEAKKQGAKHFIGLARRCLGQVFDQSSMPPAQAIWSNEGIFTSFQVMGPVLSELRDHYDVRMVVYLRRQDDWLDSAYRQWGVRHKTNQGPVLEFDEWLVRYRKNADYDRILGHWENYLGADAITVRIYEKCRDVVTDFCDVLDIDSSKFPVPAQKQHPTPDDTVLALFKLYNSQFTEQIYPVELIQLLDRSGLLTRPVHDVSLSTVTPSVEQKHDLLADFAEGNRRLTRFSTDDYEVAFPEGHSVSGQAKAVQHEHVLSALLVALVDVNRQLRTAQERIRGLEEAVSARQA